MANAQLNGKYITDRKGDQNFALDGLFLRTYRKTAHKIFCRCVVTGCSAALSTANNIPPSFGRQQHNLPADKIHYCIKIDANRHHHYPRLRQTSLSRGNGQGQQ